MDEFLTWTPWLKSLIEDKTQRAQARLDALPPRPWQAADTQRAMQIKAYMRGLERIARYAQLDGGIRYRLDCRDNTEITVATSRWNDPEEVESRRSLEYVARFDGCTCQHGEVRQGVRAKIAQQVAHGAPQPIDVAPLCWHRLLMEFVLDPTYRQIQPLLALLPSMGLALVQLPTPPTATPAAAAAA